MIFQWIKDIFYDNIKRESYREPNSVSGFGRRPVHNTEPQAVGSNYVHNTGNPNFWEQPSTKYWIAHSDLYPPAPPPSTTFKRQETNGSWKEYRICNSSSRSQFTNCYPISLKSACAMNGGELPETKKMANGDEMIVVNDFMRRNYSFKTDKDQTTLLF